MYSLKLLWYWGGVLLGNEAVDGGLKVNERAKGAALETPVGERGEKAPAGAQLAA